MEVREILLPQMARQVLIAISSHHHFDHVGDVTTFPGTTELVTGPGFKDAYYPGYPTQPKSMLHERYLQ